MIAAVVGSRDGLDWRLVKQALSVLLARDDIGTVVSGGALGVDRLAESMALAAGKRTKVYRPDWKAHGRAAGFKRNVLIVEASDEVFAFWDGKSKGTAHTIGIARRMKKPVHVFEVPCR